jgi:NAD-dependent SIR2 family protein deacetylase
MYERLYSDLTEPSPFHKVMDKLARTSHFRHYTENIDCAERLLTVSGGNADKKGSWELFTVGKGKKIGKMKSIALSN